MEDSGEYVCQAVGVASAHRVIATLVVKTRKSVRGRGGGEGRRDGRREGGREGGKERARGEGRESTSVGRSGWRKITASSPLSL